MGVNLVTGNNAMNGINGLNGINGINGTNFQGMVNRPIDVPANLDRDRAAFSQSNNETRNVAGTMANAFAGVNERGNVVAAVGVAVAAFDGHAANILSEFYKKALSHLGGITPDLEKRLFELTSLSNTAWKKYEENSANRAEFYTLLAAPTVSSLICPFCRFPNDVGILFCEQCKSDLRPDPKIL